MKRFLNVLLKLVILCGFAGLVTTFALPNEQVEAAEPGNPYNLSFELKLTDAGNQYKLNILNLDEAAAGFQSLGLNYPSYLTSNINELPLPAGWELTQGSSALSNQGSTSNSIIMDSATTAAQIKDFLSQIVFDFNPGTFNPDGVKISVSDRKIAEWVDGEGTSHYYELVPDVLSWFKAYNAAKKKNYQGLQGYLATITSEDEQMFVYNAIAKVGGWLGGTTFVNKTDKSLINDPSSIRDSSISGYFQQGNQWYWVDGPEATKVFYATKTYNPTDGPTEMYSKWNKNEPNNGDSHLEAVLEFAMQSKTDAWNDLYYDNKNAGFNEGYYVEYSEYGSQVEDPPVKAPVAGPVTVKYVDADGNPIKEDDIILGEIGNSYTTSAPDTIADYRNPKLISGSETGTFNENLQEVVYQYEQDSVSAVDAIITETEAQALKSVDDVIALNHASSSTGDMGNNVDLAAIMTPLGKDEYSHTYPVTYSIKYPDGTTGKATDVHVTVVKDGTVFPDVPAGEARPFGIYAQDASMMLEAANALADQNALDSGYTKAIVILADGTTAAATTDGTAYTTIHDATAAQVDGAPSKILVVPVAYTYTDGTYNAEKDVNVSISNGRLALVSAPTTLDFGTQKINSKRQYWATQNGNDLIVEDSRGSKAEWSLYVNQKTPIQSADNSLDGCLYYSDGTNNTLLSSADALVTAQSLAADVKEYDVSKTWGEGKAGLNLVVPNEKQQAGTYSGEVAWKLVDAPATNGTP